MFHLAYGNLNILRRKSGFSLIEVLIAATIIVGFAMSTAFTMNMFNRTASISRNYAAAETIVRDYLDRALDASWTPKVTPTILADTTASSGQTDVDGDGETDGVSYVANIPLITKRDSLTGNNQDPVVTGTLYRRCVPIGATSLNMVQVSFTIAYQYRSKNYSFTLSTVKAREK